ncbi:MAG: prolipoprotein diacylglyceryl transferase, partial [Candidatus Omnitrophota bacterium]|nr:prolipoprotein diacylglyceryl transferase [Candidatus Omnitrophota bacterium]
MLVLAFFAAAFLAGRQARREKVDAEKIFNLLFFVFISGIVGSRVFYVAINFPFYLRDPLEMIMLQHGGMAWFGGLIFGFAAGSLFIKKNKMGLLKTLDLLAPFIALGQAIGRIGCLLNGCCFGKPAEFGLLIPTQLYSSLL